MKEIFFIAVVGLILGGLQGIVAALIIVAAVVGLTLLAAWLDIFGDG